MWFGFGEECFLKTDEVGKWVKVFSATLILANNINSSTIELVGNKS